VKLLRIFYILWIAFALVPAPAGCEEKPGGPVNGEDSPVSSHGQPDDVVQRPDYTKYSGIKDVFESGANPTAPVILDGEILFRVRGMSSFPANIRAEMIRQQILAVARDKTFQIDGFKIVTRGSYHEILGNQIVLLKVFEADAEIEGIDRYSTAYLYAYKITQAVKSYRAARMPEKLAWEGVIALLTTLLTAGIIVLIVKYWRRLDAYLEGRYKSRLKSLEIQSFQVLRSENIWSVFHGLIKTLRLVIYLALGYVYVNFVLNLFPWTQALSQNMLDYILDPLKVMGKAVLDYIPSLIFLILLAMITRYALGLMQSFFNAISHGVVKFEGFEPEWSRPTFRLCRIVVIAIAAVFAYPYIPGSGSEAFKGISLFAGVLFSLGSSSIISNMIAGYTLVYRRAFKIGDRVKINDTVGDVTRIRNLVTHLQTIHNEEVIIPNSIILNGEVLNYSSLGSQQKLILYTTVGIGYEVPWRQVEAMLLMAAERTSRVLKTPRPFVLQKVLGDYAVLYELNAYCVEPLQMPQIYTQLHRNILDVFNEYGVQIMTPSYEGDPEQVKVVEKQNWYAAPAKVEG
jgi:small-conductance mechanosensitive channel